MKFLVVLAAVAAIASAQFRQQQSRFGANGFGSSGFGQASAYAQVAPAPVFREASAYAQVAPALVARAASGEAAANILRLESDITPDGSYSYAYETDNGIAAQAQGQFRDFGGGAAADVAQGSFSWTSPEGQPISISYIADENGYRAVGDALPTPPPIPPQIARALEYIARNPSKQQNF